MFLSARRRHYNDITLAAGQNYVLAMCVSECVSELSGQSSQLINNIIRDYYSLHHALRSVFTCIVQLQAV